MFTTIRYILLTALRDWLFGGLFIALCLAAAISSFLGSTALVEKSQMSISFTAGSTRVILLTGIIVFVCFHVRRAFENREIEVIISRPISRESFVIAYWLGFSLISLLLIAPLIAAIGIFWEVNLPGLLYWGSSIILEALLVVAFSLFTALILRSAVSAVMLCFGFYFLSRLMGFFLFILEKPYLFREFNFGVVTEKLLNLVSVIIPRLDQYGKSDWLIYGINGDLSFQIFVTQSLIYVPFLLLMAIFDFKCRQF